MARKVPIDRLAGEIEKILSEYGQNVQQNLNEVTKAVAKKGAKALRSESASTFDGTGKYAKGWTSRTETGRISAQGTIYNEDLPGLPHLLEHGHANRSGGRTPGRAHIAKVEEAIIREFEQKVKSKL